MSVKKKKKHFQTSVPVKDKLSDDQARDLMHRYIEKFGVKNVARVWGSLAKLEPFVEAIQSELGGNMYAGVADKMGVEKAKYEAALLNGTESTEKLDKKGFIAFIRYKAFAEIIADYNAKWEAYHKLNIE
jgi:hypothetical protein